MRSIANRMGDTAKWLVWQNSDSPATGTRDVTSYLRGLVLVVVMTNHYINRYVTDRFTFYANGAVAVFFVLSGYGIYHSLDREFRTERPWLVSLFQFYFRRALRIFPLYWLFLLVYAATEGAVPSIWVWLGIPVELAPGIGWFVTLLIQCYLVAPLLYLVLQTLGAARYTVLVIAALLLVWALGVVLPVSVPYLSIYSYRGMAVSHMLLFSLGMAMPNLLAAIRHRPPSYLMLVSFFIMVATLHYTRFQYLQLTQYLAPLFLFSTFAFCCLAVLGKPHLALGKALILIGTYSYSIYLFHLSLYDVLEAVGVLQYSRWSGILFVLLTLPLFVVACIGLEKLTADISDRFQAMLRLSENISRKS